MKQCLIVLLLLFAFTVRVPISVWNTIPDQEDFVHFIGTLYNMDKKNNCKKVNVIALEDKEKKEILFEFECLKNIWTDL
jgi:uncharacterized membrane protein